MLIDDITINVAAGDGGRGAVSFNKNKESLGPTGGSGGNGGSVYCQGVFDIGALRQFRFKKSLEAENGENGKSQFNDGRTGVDLILKVPIGTVIHNLNNGSIQEIIDAKEPLLLAQGGHGGKGNFLFRSSRNTTPKQFQQGLPGEKFTVRFELKLIADVGFVGFPNAGKSSLLNELTQANIKVANYPFTTLEPNLGAYYGLILADIPGLIEGASAGKGLGIKFLRHVERTKILFHFISTESEDPKKDYHVIREELKAYNKELLLKKEYLFLSKSDAASPADIQKKLATLKKLNPSVMPISIYDADSMSKVKKILNEIAKEKLAAK
ncbi:MAG: GTPase ObgE [Candidatus Niyogibacteria bacterium]|nr:GTPase ObgE [Candidatus Niyogibacteria bacterium]